MRKRIVALLLSVLMINQHTIITADVESYELVTVECTNTIKVQSCNDEPQNAYKNVAVSITKTVSEYELYLMAHLIYNEVGILGEKAMYYCGSVVLNRVKSNIYPNTIHDVIYQRGQYACTWDGNFEREPKPIAYKIAEDLLLNGSVIPSNVLFQAQFKQGSYVYSKIGNTYFCGR